MKRVRRQLVSLMLDSGAYSAWKSGASIDLDEYVKFIKKYGEYFESCVALDVIPGSAGSMENADIEKAAAESRENYLAMRDQGLDPIPVFHQGEDMKWLERMLDDGAQYVGISPYMRSSINQVIDWMDKCFDIVTDRDGRPIVKTHCFGATALPLVMRFPFYTADSTTWKLIPGYGRIKIPAERLDGSYDFSVDGIALYVSTEAPADMSGQNLDKWLIKDMHLERVTRFLEYCGVSLADVRTNLHARELVYLTYCQMVVAHRGEFVQFARRGGRRFFSSCHDHKVGKDFGFKLIYAVSAANHIMSSVLTTANANDRLLSYYDLRQRRDPDDLREYVTKGYLGEDPLVNQARSLRGKKPNWEKRYYTDFRRWALSTRINNEQTSTT